MSVATSTTAGGLECDDDEKIPARRTSQRRRAEDEAQRVLEDISTTYKNEHWRQKDGLRINRLRGT